MTQLDPPNAPTAPRVVPASRARLIGLAVLVALAGVAIYRPTLSSDFIALDDPQYVVDNPYVRHPTWQRLGLFFTEVLNPSTVAGYYQPLTMASLMLDRVIGAHLGGGYAREPQPSVFHLHNIALHGINAALVVLLVWHITRRPAIAVAGGLLLALHPLNVEPVAWICQRKALLSTTFVLLTFLAYGRWART